MNGQRKKKTFLLQSTRNALSHKANSVYAGKEPKELRKRCPVSGTGRQCSAVITTQTHCESIKVLTLILTYRENKNRLQIVKTIFKRRNRIEEFTPLGFQNPLQGYDIRTVVLVSRQTNRPKQWNSPESTLHTYIQLTLCILKFLLLS